MWPPFHSESHYSEGMEKFKFTLGNLSPSLWGNSGIFRWLAFFVASLAPRVILSADARQKQTRRALHYRQFQLRAIYILSLSFPPKEVNFPLGQGVKSALPNSSCYSAKTPASLAIFAPP